MPEPPDGRDVLLEIDLQGARQVRRLRPDATLILLKPPSPDVQEARLRARGDDEAHIAERLRTGADEEQEGRAIADAVVVNHDVAQATAEVAGIVDRYRSPPEWASLPSGNRRSSRRDPGRRTRRPTRRIVMAQTQITLMDPPIEELLDKVDSKFTLVALASRRARQVNSYYNSLGEGLGVVVPPQVASASGKPLSIAFEEVAAGKATYTRPDPEEVALAEAAALALLEGEGAEARPRAPSAGPDADRRLAGRTGRARGGMIMGARTRPSARRGR